MVQRSDLKVYINGEIVPAAEARLSVFDHGVLYGDGVFEGLRSYNGAVFKLAEHTHRLFASAKYIALDISMTHEQVDDATLATLAANGLFGNAYIRTVVTRGEGDLGINPKKCYGKPTVFIITADIELYPQFIYEHGLRVITLSVPQKPVAGASAMVKSLNYLNNILGTLQVNNYNSWMRGREFKDLSDDEKLMFAGEGVHLSADGYVTEATADNIFIARNGCLITPPISEGLLGGITRDSVFEMAGELGIEAREARMTVYDLYTCDECFLTGSAAELVPVREIDGRRIGSGVDSFDAYARLKEYFPKYVARYSTPVPRS
jgi:branched-chain amino acid aminotransferase